MKRIERNRFETEQYSILLFEQRKNPGQGRQICLTTNLIRLWIEPNESSEAVSVEITLNHIVSVKSLPTFHRLSWDWQHPGT